MTVSSVIPAAPAQPAAPKSPSSGSNDQSNSFYSYLRSSTRNDAEELPKSKVSESTTKTSKSEKQSGKKADSEQTATGPTVTPATPQTTQTAPVLSIAALLGLTAHQSTDVAETGTTESGNEQETLASLSTDPDKQPEMNIGVTANAGVVPPTAKPGVLNTAPTAEALTESMAQAESVTDDAQPSQKSNLIDTALNAKSFDVSSVVIAPMPEANSSSSKTDSTKENKRLSGAQPDNTASAQTSINSVALPDTAVPQQSPKLSASPSSVEPSKESTKPSSLPRNRDAGTTAKVDTIASPDVAPSLLPESVPSKIDNQPDALKVGNAAASSQGNDSNADLTAAGTSPNPLVSNSPVDSLAFALRLSESSSGSNPQPQPQGTAVAEPLARASASVSNTDGAAIVQAAAESQAKEQFHQHEGSEGAVLYGTSQAHSQNAPDASQSEVSSAQAVQTTAPSLDSRHDMASSEPVRNVHLQVVGEDNNRVDVRLMDRGGELHVSVKSGDTNLAQNLQDHMPELTSRLEQQRFQTEVWTPKLADNGKAETTSARDFSSSSSGNNSSHGGNASDGQGKRQQKYQPDWVDVLENSTQNTGKNHQSWLQ